MPTVRIERVFVEDGSEADPYYETRVYVDGEFIGRGDYGGEPEDNSIFRGYDWVQPILAKLAEKLGAEVEQKKLVENKDGVDGGRRMSQQSKQLIFCNACGKEMYVEFYKVIGREFKVCSSECLREIGWRRALSITGEHYHPDPSSEDMQVLNTLLAACPNIPKPSIYARTELLGGVQAEWITVGGSWSIEAVVVRGFKNIHLSAVSLDDKGKDAELEVAFDDPDEVKAGALWISSYFADTDNTSETQNNDPT